MRYWIAAAALASGLLISGASLAETSAADWLARYDASDARTKALHEIEILGNYNGIAWNQAALKNNPAKAICVPGQLILEHGQLVSIVRQFIKAHPREGTAPFGLALYLGLRNTFPC